MRNSNNDCAPKAIGIGSGVNRCWPWWPGDDAHPAGCEIRAIARPTPPRTGSNGPSALRLRAFQIAKESLNDRRVSTLVANERQRLSCPLRADARTLQSRFPAVRTRRGDRLGV